MPVFRHADPEIRRAVRIWRQREKYTRNPCSRASRLQGFLYLWKNSIQALSPRPRGADDVADAVEEVLLLLLGEVGLDDVKFLAAHDANGRPLASGLSMGADKPDLLFINHEEDESIAP